MKQWLVLGLALGLPVLIQAQTWPAADELAAWEGLTASRVAELVRAGAEVNQRFEFDETPLMKAAAYARSPEALRALLAAGADLDARTDEGLTALMFAAEYNSNPVVAEVLLDAGAEVDATALVSLTALMLAAEHNENPEMVKLLLAAGAEVDAKAVDSLAGRTALMWAAKDNPNPAVVEALLAAGADPTGRDAEGRTAAVFASQNPALRDSEVYKKLKVRFSPAFLIAEGYPVDPWPVDILRYSERPADMYEVPDLVFVGWSPKGSFAYIEDRSVEGVGGSRTAYVVIDAVEDKTLFRVVVDDTDPQQPADHEEARAGFLQALEKADIRSGGGAKLLPFPLSRGADRFSCEIRTVPEADEDKRLWFDEIYSYEVVVGSTLQGEKRITGASQVSAKSLWVAGCVASPFEPRILVILGKEEFVFEGTEAFFLFSGSSLAAGFKKN